MPEECRVWKGGKEWLGRKESNLRIQIQSLLSYR